MKHNIFIIVISEVKTMSVTCGNCNYKDSSLEDILVHSHAHHPHLKLQMTIKDSKHYVKLQYDTTPKQLECKKITFMDDYTIEELPDSLEDNSAR